MYNHYDKGVKMDTAFTKKELDHLLHFIGYGRLDAPVWFIGTEEAGGGEDNLRARLNFRQIEDNYEAHKKLGILKHHEGKKVIQRTWRGMCYIMLCLEGKEPDREAIRHYQANLLGRYHGKTLLTELLPVPKPKTGDWGYEELIPQFSSREEYKRKIKPFRIKMFKDLLKKHNPKTVICYGKGCWEDYKAIFSEIAFYEGKPFVIGEKAETLVILTPHFVTKEMNGQFEKIVEIIKTKKIFA